MNIQVKFQCEYIFTPEWNILKKSLNLKHLQLKSKLFNLLVRKKPSLGQLMVTGLVIYKAFSPLVAVALRWRDCGR